MADESSFSINPDAVIRVAGLGGGVLAGLAAGRALRAIGARRAGAVQIVGGLVVAQVAGDVASRVARRVVYWLT